MLMELSPWRKIANKDESALNRLEKSEQLKLSKIQI